MFEFLVNIYNEQKKKRNRNPAEYDLTTDRMKYNVNSPGFELIEDGDLVNFYMAWSLKSIQKIPPSPQHPVHLNYFNNEFIEHAKYSWTAFMVLGMLLPELKFSDESIFETSVLSEQKNFFSDYLQRNRLLILKKQLLEEKGYFARFGTNSLFEKEFKVKLDEKKIRNFLKLTDTENTERNFIKFKWNELCSKIKELDDSTDNSNQLKPLIDDIDINYCDDEDGYTLLMFAVTNKKFRIAEYLLSIGADPLIFNKFGGVASDLTPFDAPVFTLLKGYELLYSSYLGSFHSVQKTIDEGAEINFQGLGGYSALLIAVEQGNAEITEYLLSEGADISLTRLDGQGVFELVTDSKVLDLLNNSIEEPVIEKEREDDDNGENKKEINISQNSQSFFSGVTSVLYRVSGMLTWNANKK